jgi:hypothetical protein
MEYRMVGSVIGESWFLFTCPVWLVSIPLAALPVLLAWFARRHGRRIPISAVIAQCIALTLVVAALARPKAPIGKQADLPYLLLSDMSGSVRGQDRPIHQLDFPSGAKVERFGFADGITQSRSLRTDSTLIAPALRLIASRGPNALAAAIIETDGRFAETDYSAAAQAVADLGVQVHIVPLDAPPADARIVAFAVRRISDTQVEITADVSANSPLKRTLTITRRGQSHPLAVRQLSLTGNSPSTVRVTDAVASDAWGQYSVSLTGDVVITENDSASTLVLPARQVIAAGGIGSDARPVLREIRHPVTFISHDAMPTDAAALARFSAIIVSDATGSSLSLEQRRALAQYVRAGGGLTLVGTGPHETPSDREGPLNRVLPLLANPFERRPLHLVVLLDKSGSMAQPTARTAGGSVQIKFDLASEAVIALKDHLTVRDTLMVIAFSDRPEVVYDSGDKPGDFTALREAMKKVRPSGSTRVTPAIEAALLKSPPTGRKTMLLIVSDLKTEQFDPSEWAGAFRRSKAGLAVVAIREHSSASPGDTVAPIKSLAKLLDAPYVERDRLAGLAKVFAKLVRRGRGDVLRRKHTALTVPAALFDTGLTALPDIDAYILSAARKNAEILVRTTGGEPVGGRCPAGLGRCVCLAVPISKKDNEAWASSAEVAKLISASIRWTLRRTNDPRFNATIKRLAGRIEIMLTARDKGLPVNGLELSAEIISGSGEETRGANFDQVAPGEYRARADWPADSPAGVAVRDNKGVTLWRGQASVLYRCEYRSIGADGESLRRLADLTGGEIVPAGKLRDVLKRAYHRRMTDLWPWLLAAALALMLGEWCLARITRR